MANQSKISNPLRLIDFLRTINMISPIVPVKTVCKGPPMVINKLLCGFSFQYRFCKIVSYSLAFSLISSGHASYSMFK